MTYTEEYREHIEYTFHAYCKIVIYHAAIDAAKQRHRRCEKEISLEYLTEEKHYPLSTFDEYFTEPEPEVLLIDADAQANLTMALGYNRPDELPVTLSTIVQNICQKSKTIYTS